MTRPAALDRIVSAWRRPVDAATRRALFSVLVVAFIAVALIGRLGSLPSRLSAVALLLAATGFVLLVAYRGRKAWQGVASAIRRALVPADRSLGERALRAVTLVERTESDPTVGSTELAHLHLERLIARASTEAVESAARQRASRLRAVFGILLVGAGAVLVIAPMRVIEGFDVLAARHGRAPVDMTWLSEVQLAVQPPAYLHGVETSVYFGTSLAQPAGSVITLRGRPSRPGRQLVLSDGRREVPFVSDGRDGMVARYTLIDDATLTIAARFGGVLIAQSEPLVFKAEADETPRVTLGGAPTRFGGRTDSLRPAPVRFKLEDLESLDVQYTASDDHGLREVDLVMRSGGREKRRVLSRLDGQSIGDHGGTVLHPSDRFLRKTFLPVVITVEARDNDGLSGPKWGKSLAITIDPPVLGAPEAARLAALERARDALTDLVALTMRPAPSKAEEREHADAEERDATGAAVQAMQSAGTGVYSGLRVPAGLTAFFTGQVRRLGQQSPRSALGKRAEDVVLAVDVAVRMLAQRDAQGVAKRLGDVAEEAGDAARQARDAEEHDRGLERLDVAIGALESSGKALQQLGQLGADLGSVTLSELRRIRRSRDEKELIHAEAAARHLAARLRRPNPSFSASQRGGVESGLSGSGAGSGEASKANERFDELSHQLEQLAQDHAQGIVDVTDALEQAERSQDLDALKSEASRRAQAVRDSISGLPESGRRQSAAEASAALAREHAGAMAENLEAVQLERSVQSGKDALEALAEAERKAEQDPEEGALDRAEVARARSEIQSQLGWAQKQLDDMRRQAEERAKSDLDKSGERENDLAERARALHETGSQGEGTLPKETTDALERAQELMQDAARELRAGHGEEGNSLQMEAQRWLEQSQPHSTQDPDEGQSGDDDQDRQSDSDDGRRGMARKAPVPKDKGNQVAEDFRKRVLRGLTQAHGDRLSPAIKRYAERLLQ